MFISPHIRFIPRSIHPISFHKKNSTPGAFHSMFTSTHIKLLYVHLSSNYPQSRSLRPIFFTPQSFLLTLYSPQVQFTRNLFQLKWVHGTFISSTNIWTHAIFFHIQFSPHSFISSHIDSTRRHFAWSWIHSKYFSACINSPHIHLFSRSFQFTFVVLDNYFALFALHRFIPFPLHLTLFSPDVFFTSSLFHSISFQSTFIPS